MFYLHQCLSVCPHKKQILWNLNNNNTKYPGTWYLCPVIPCQQCGGYIQTVSVRVCPSIFQSVRPKRKSSHSHNFSPILTKFIQHFFYTACLYRWKHLKYALSWKMAKMLPWQPFLFSSLNAYLLMFVPYFKAWR